MTEQEMLFAMLRTVICGWQADDSVKNACTEELLKKTAALAQKHDLVHLVGQAAADWKLPENETTAGVKKASMQAFLRYARIDCVFRKLCEAFERANVMFLPLKGSVLREWYPQPWMRTSCDIDVLVQENRLEQAAEVLESALSCRRGSKGDHDISFHSPEGVHVELHYAAVDEGRLPAAQQVLKNIWQHAAPTAQGNFCVLSDEMFYFYHIAHMAKHIENGGCGVRPLLDLWILDHRMEHDALSRQKLLEQGGMLQFARVAQRVAGAWLSGEPVNPEDLCFSQFVLNGGVYGTMAAHVAVMQAEKGGKLQYLLSRAFLPYDKMKYYYPAVVRHKWMMPAFQVRRWFRIWFCGGASRSFRQMKSSANLTKQETHAVLSMLDSLGLRQ